MKKSACFMLFLFLLTLAVFTFSCSAAGIINVDNEGNTSINQGALKSSIDNTPLQNLSDAEKTGILYMREEEKLAHDVYSELYNKWGTNNFNNIGSSEQTHMDAVKTLIDKYNLEDPAQGKGTGEFTSQKLQDLYNQLMEQGKKSEIDALNVGAAIEEIDIIDLEDYLAGTENPDIITVYQNLIKGSRNHLRSFVSVMQKQGINYEPQYLNVKDYNDIIGSGVERGNR